MNDIVQLLCKYVLLLHLPSSLCCHSYLAVKRSLQLIRVFQLLKTNAIMTLCAIINVSKTFLCQGKVRFKIFLVNEHFSFTYYKSNSMFRISKGYLYSFSKKNKSKLLLFALKSFFLISELSFLPHFL